MTLKLKSVELVWKLDGPNESFGFSINTMFIVTIVYVLLENCDALID